MLYLWVETEIIRSIYPNQGGQKYHLVLASYNPDDNHEYIDTETFCVTTYRDKVMAETYAGVLRNILHNGGAAVTLL